jgi:ABC-type proline/glycine betaine transport system substrate-binding protein
MKKVILGTGIALLAVISLSSCKKDYSCQCTVTSNTTAVVFGGVEIQPATSTTASATTIINGKKKDVETACTAGSSVVAGAANANGGVTTITSVCSVID